MDYKQKIMEDVSIHERVWSYPKRVHRTNCVSQFSITIAKSLGQVTQRENDSLPILEVLSHE